LKSPVRKICTPGSVRGRSGNWLSYRDSWLKLMLPFKSENIVEIIEKGKAAELIKMRLCSGWILFVFGGLLVLLALFLTLDPNSKLISLAVGLYFINEGSLKIQSAEILNSLVELDKKWKGDFLHARPPG
jgi:hypothetical protein